MKLNANIFLKEMKQYRKATVIWSFCISALVMIGMAFYPVLTRGETFKQVSVLLKNPFIKSLISAFGANLEGLTNVLGFYSFRNSIFVMLLGSFFSILVAGKILSQEEREKTAEFLLSKPVTRTEVVLSKMAAFLASLSILNVVVLAVGFTSLELFRGKSDYPVAAFFIHGCYAFLVMLTFGAAGLFVSLWMKRGRSITGISVGIVMAAYFFDVLSKVSESAAWIGYTSPFRYVDSVVLRPGYGLSAWRVAYFLGLSVLFFALTLVTYRKKDILV